MPETPFTPPFRKPVSEFKTPDQTIIFVTELVNRDDPAYTANAPVKRGTLYKDIVGGDERLSTTHPLLYFCRELKYQQSDQYVIWEWSSDEHAHSSYNAAISYEMEDAGFPVYTREYTIRRDEYEQNPTLTIGDPLEALIGVNIIDGGQDFTYATGEIEDKDATITFVVSDGVIISGVVTNEGSGIVSSDTITITGDGGGATITPMVQPTSAVLTAQKKEELPDDDPWRNEFVKVTRVYQTLPGPTIHSTQLHVDGVVVDVATTLKVASTITSGQTLNGGVWTMTTKEQSDNDYTAKEIVSTRAVPGNPIPSTTIDADGDIITETRTLVEGPPTLVTSITTAGGVWTKTFAEALTNRLTIGEEASDLVSWKIVQVKLTQAVMDSYEAEIPDLVPEQFRAKLPVTTHEETLVGFASAITIPLAAGVLMEKKAQIDYNTYRHIVRSRTFTEQIQIINYEITSEFGGGRVAETITLDLFNNLTPIDGSLTILSSNLIHIDDQVNGLAVQTTRELDDSAWPILPSRFWDSNTRQEYDETKQVIDTGTAEDPNPGVFSWVSEVRALDRWKAQKTNTSMGAPQYVDEASALITYEFKPFKFPGLLTPTAYGYYVRSAFAELIQHKLRTWWLSSSTTPTVGIPGSGADVEVEEILPDNVVISTLNDVTVLQYSGMVLHDDLTTFLTLFWPETTPSYTTYLASWQGYEKVIAGTVTQEKEKDVWKIVTESVIMR